MRENICLFTPTAVQREVLQIINCVYETTCPDTETVRLSTYRLLLVTNGSGTVKVWERNYDLTVGDLFLLPPAVPLRFTGNRDLQYMYIGFLGTRASRLAEELHATTHGLHIRGMKAVESLWQTVFSSNTTTLSLRGEGVLLYTLAAMLDHQRTGMTVSRENALVPTARHYIEDHLTEPTLSLSAVAAALGYHPKYLSAAFKKETGIGLTEYIASLRIRHACALIDGGTAAVKDLAFLCGYADPLYFSTVFKKYTGTSPSHYIRENAEERGG